MKSTVNGEIDKTVKTFPPPLLGWYQSTNYMRAFIITSAISALVVPVSSQINDLLKYVRVPSSYRLIVGMIVTFTSSMIVLVTMRRLFGTGGSMLAAPDRGGSFWYPSAPSI